MGWFWADADPAQAAAAAVAAATPLSSRLHAQPPVSIHMPSCPMHNQPFQTTPPPPPADKPSGCPIKHHNAPVSTSTAEGGSTSQIPSYIQKLNPLNYMPESLSNQRDYTQQSVSLPLEREASTIPRGDDPRTKWEYPSPQQMYNAMLRKGYTDTPAEHVEAMVAVHNFLNEGAWEEIRGWERRFFAGLGKGWELCRRGEEGYARTVALAALRGRQRGTQGEDEFREPSLMRFEGRPDELTPKARMLQFMSWLWPSGFPNNPPFDRHDWYVRRETPGGKTKEVRYCIDYYSGPPEPTGEPVFYLDVRPAVDGPTAACERLIRWGGDIWWRASGGSVREELARQTKRQ